MIYIVGCWRGGVAGGCLNNGFIAETLRGIKKLAWLWSLVFGGGEIRYDYD